MDQHHGRRAEHAPPSAPTVRVTVAATLNEHMVTALSKLLPRERDQHEASSTDSSPSLPLSPFFIPEDFSIVHERRRRRFSLQSSIVIIMFYHEIKGACVFFGEG